MTTAERKEIQAARTKSEQDLARMISSPQGLVMLFPQMEKIFKKPETVSE